MPRLAGKNRASADTQCTERSQQAATNTKTAMRSSPLNCSPGPSVNVLFPLVQCRCAHKDAQNQPSLLWFLCLRVWSSGCLVCLVWCAVVCGVKRQGCQNVKYGWCCACYVCCACGGCGVVQCVSRVCGVGGCGCRCVCVTGATCARTPRLRPCWGLGVKRERTRTDDATELTGSEFRAG